MKQWKEVTLKREDQCNFHCRIIGEGKPLLLIHGAACDSEFFIDTAPAFAQRYQVIIYDRSGYGKSLRQVDPPACGSEEYFFRQGDDAAWVLQQLVPGQKAVVIGCSCGAAVAAYMAAGHPECIEQVFLHEPPIYSLIPELTDCWDLIDGINEAIAQKKYNRALNRFLLFLASSAAPSKKPMTEAEMDNFTNNGLLFVKQEFQLAFDKEFGVPPIETNVALLWGEDGEGLPLVQCAHKAAEVLGCPIHKIPGGHNAAREDPEIFAQAVFSILDA